ncbi:amidase [Podospora conica]|nr:amidase [Schizothecium conicum]
MANQLDRRVKYALKQSAFLAVAAFSLIFCHKLSSSSALINATGRRQCQESQCSGTLGLDALDLGGIQAQLMDGLITSEALVRTYQARIAEVNGRVRAIGCLNPEALALAVERDEQRRAGKILGELHGIPILVKDIFVTNDTMETTGGSYALIGAKFRKPSTIVDRLEAAGAIILGKANLSEWGMARSPKCSNGWSALYGQALAGFYENQDPQGSSSGNAIAASMNLAAANIGGETCGSILFPAGNSGVVGLKPTVGLTSRSGLIPLNPEHDSAGPITRWVKDSAMILQVIAGKDELDPATQDIPFDSIPNYVAACSVDGCRGLRIAIPKSVSKSIGSRPELQKAFEGAIHTLGQLGAVFVVDDDFDKWKPNGGQREDLFGDVLLREAYEKFFGDLVVNPHNIRTISDLIEFTKRTPEEEYERLGAGWFENARDAVGSSQSEAFLACKTRMDDLGNDLVRLLDRTNCDVLLATPTTDLPLDLGRLPGITVPMGYYSKDMPETKGTCSGGLTKLGPNIPQAVLFTGRRFSEEKLIACAYAFEQATLKVADAPGRLIVKPSSDITSESTTK